MTGTFTDRNPNLVTVDIDALRHNVALLARSLQGDARLMPVVKSDAYGHGIVEVSRGIEEMPEVWGFGISTISEALVLRDAGISKPLFLLSGCFPGEEQAVAGLGLTVGVISEEMLDALQDAASGLRVNIPVHLKADTGMGRFGFCHDELVDIAGRLDEWPLLGFEGLYTHMPVADSRHDPFNNEQIARFRRLVADVRRRGWHPKYVHMANSAAVLNFPDSHFNLARPGIGIYGCLPSSPEPSYPRLRPVMSFRSRLVSVRRFHDEAFIGYGRTGRVEKNSVVAVIPAGYDDGCMRSLSNSGKVLVKGVRCNIVGRVCMRALMVDVSHVQGVATGDTAVFIGQSGAGSITANELAVWAGTISYELLCLIGTRNRRIFLHSGH